MAAWTAGFYIFDLMLEKVSKIDFFNKIIIFSEIY